jgi:hypothetical protein
MRPQAPHGIARLWRAMPRGSRTGALMHAAAGPEQVRTAVTTRPGSESHTHR